MSMSSWNVPPPTYDAHSTTTSYMSTTLTPYLQLSHLLSLTWLAYPILSLIFIAFRLQLSLASAQDAALNAKDQLLTSCKAAEEAATSTASMPRYMALATNQQYADAINASMNAARAALVLSLTAMEAIINFIIDLYRSTLLCFLEFVVRGGLSILIGAVQEINTLLSTVTSGLRTSIQNDIASANNVIKSAIDAINKVNPFDDISAPQINVPSLDALQNVTLPPSFEDALSQLNASLPSVADIKDKLEDVINTPFELLKKDINDTFAGVSFQPESLPVPELNRLTFCNQLDTSVIDDIGQDLIKMAKIGVVIIILLALLLIGLNCLLTWYKWRCMHNHLEYTRQAWLTDPTLVHTTGKSTVPQITLSDHNLMMLLANSEHPLITKITNQLSARFKLTPSQHTHTLWFFNYIFHAPALACFLIGFFGLMSVQIQLWAMGPLEAKYQARAAATVSDFSTTIATSITQSMYNQSSLYANEINGRVDGIQATINDGVFGWVNGTTTTLNTTINTFYTDIQQAVTTVFGGTILEVPANTFLQCFIGSKVDAIENALTFLHDNLHVDMPRLDQSVLILSPDSVNEAAQPIATAAIGGGDGDDQGLIGRLVNSYAASLRKERVMFGIFLALWGLVILMGLAVVFWHSFGRSYLEKRGRRKWEAEQRSGLDNVRQPFNGVERGSVKATTTKEFHSFSPLPSPKGSVFKPFWSSRSNSPVGSNKYSASPLSSTGSVMQQHNLDEAAYSQPREAPVPSVGVEKKKTQKLLAIGRRAMSRGERLKKDGSEELSATLSPIPISESAGEYNRNTTWYGKMATLLTRKESVPAREGIVDFWDDPAPTRLQNEKARPKLQVYTQRGLDKYGPPPKHPQQLVQPPQSAATQTTRMNIMSPTKAAPVPAPTPAVVTTREPSSYLPFTSPYPQPIGVSIRSRPVQNPNVPLDVGLAYDEDPFMAPTTANSRAAEPAPTAIVLPMPLHNGFDTPQNLPHSRAAPPRHPGFGHGRRRQDSSPWSPPPPPLKSPRMLQPPLALAPPPARSTSLWRVTNAAPGDTASLGSSLAGNIEVEDESESDMETTPVTRLLTTTHARRSSSVNPFITPFDDEHRVMIDHPTEAARRKSIPTNPFTGHAV